MKKLLLLLLAAFFIFQLKAVSQKTRFGFNAGATLANMYSKVDDEKENGDSKMGFTVGVLADIPLGGHLSFQPGLNFTQKGTKDKDAELTVKMNLNYLELPFNLLYNSDRSAGNFFIGAGPSFGFGLSGKTTVEFQGDKESEKIHFGNGDSDDLKRFEFGANIVAGYSAKSGFRVALNYNHGISNLFTGGSSDGKLRNSYFGLGVGYLFGNKN